MVTGIQGDIEPILATGGYDHTIKIWSPYSGTAIRTLQHGDSQVNSLAIQSKSETLAAGGFQTIRLYDLNTNNPIVNFEGVSKNVTSLGFQVNMFVVINMLIFSPGGKIISGKRKILLCRK